MSSQDIVLYGRIVIIDLHASRNSAGTLVGYYHQADILLISTNITVTSMSMEYRLTLHFYITRRHFIN